MGNFNSGGFLPTFDGYMRFNTSSFAPSASISAEIVQDNLCHNAEWLYGTHTQIRVNWTNEDGRIVGGETSPLTPLSQSFLFSDGPFMLSISDDGTPFPLYIRIEAGIVSDPANDANGTIHVHLRQNDNINNKYFDGEVGTIDLTGNTISRGIFELTTPSSSLSTSSSILEIAASDVRPLKRLPVRTTRSLSVADDQVNVLFCWLDFYGVPKNEEPTQGFVVYSVFAQELCPKKST